MQKLATMALLTFLFAQAAFADGKHVILLIDDSKDMKGWRDTLEAKLPGWLFRGPNPADPSTPRFDPATDTLSVLYFTLRNEGAADECKAARGDVISAATLLHLETIAAPDEASFRHGLRESLNRSCRFDGHLSPIVLSPILALPYMQKRLPAGELFSRVLIATATNDEFNFQGSTPSAELSYLVKEFPQFGVQAPADTSDLASAVMRTFNFDAPMEWRDERIGLRYRVIEAVPRGRAPDSAMVFNRRIQLDRVAAGDDRVLGVPKIPGTGDIRIPRSELIPLAIEAQLSGDSRPFAALDLTRCGPPACSSDGEGMQIDLFHPAVNPIAQSAKDASLGPRTLFFRAGFRLDTNGRIYDRLRLESMWQQMELTPIAPTSAWLIAYPLRVDNSLLTKLWFRGDGTPPRGGLTQEEGVTRLRRLNFGAWFVTIVLLVLAIARAARRSRVYSFMPEVEWVPAAQAVIDFDRPGYSRVLAGSLVVRNRGPVGWLGQRLGGVEQPTRVAAVSLDADVAKLLADAGFELRPDVAIGFFDEQRNLVANVRDAVSEGRQIHVFLAEDSIADFHARGEIEEQVIPLRIPVKLQFAVSDVAAPRFTMIGTTVTIDVLVKPESSRAPAVAYERTSSGDLYYRHDARLPIGVLIFQSRAEHSFAQPFHGTYALATTCEKRPLAGTPLRFDSDSISLGAHERAELRVALWCGAPEVDNPTPVTHHYTFAPQGPHEAEYPADALSFDLRRDPTRSEIVLQLTYRSTPVEVHWDPARKAWACRARGVDVTVDGNVVRFAKASRYRFGGQDATKIALGIEIGNSAKSGKGFVAVQLSGALKLAGDAAGALHLLPEGEPSDIIEFPTDRVLVREGEQPVNADAYFRSAPIASIDGGEIAADKCTVRIALQVEIRTDDGQVEKRSLAVELPLHLEQLPGPNVVVIDFGTSSIAAAVGTAGERNDKPLLDLQHVPVHRNESVATVDPSGPEAGTPFIPSGIVCDADERQNATDYGREIPPGFPRHTGAHGASLLPSSPSFITLPARLDDFANRPGRVLLSLKTWLGMNAQQVPIPSGEIRFLEGTKLRTDSAVPLDDLLEASYAALAQAYLLKHESVKSGRVVICHPNTFSSFHRERLRRLAWNALARPLEIISPKHLHLMSESDAVAYAYCADRMRETRPSGTERLLVYDLGAGTLDLSVVTIEWNADAVYPIFRSRHHLGVPIAGNYFDETLARIIHELLSDKDVLGADKLQYRFPIVTSEQPTVEEHAKASRASWNDIRQAKQLWTEGADFEVVVGQPGGSGLVQRIEGAPVPTDIQGLAGVVLRNPDNKGEQLILVIPEAQLTSHPRIVRLVEFLTREVVHEALAVAGLRGDDIDTLIVSGRGALWPGLKERVRKEVRNARLAPLHTSENMKAAVARGAIARQYFVRQNAIEEDASTGGRLAVVYGHEASTHAIFEDQWNRPITIPVGNFRIVNVSIRKPDPARDLGNGSLRKHFYVGVGRDEYTTQQFGGTVLRFEKQSGGEILIENEDKEQFRVGRRDTVHYAYAAWPVGHAFLSPDEEQA